MQASYIAQAAAIVAITTSGRTARICAKYRPQCPIVAVTRFTQVARQMQLHRGIIPLYYKGTYICSYVIKGLFTAPLVEVRSSDIHTISKTGNIF